MRFLGISNVEQSMDSLRIKVEIVGITRNVNVRSYAPSVEVRLAVMWRFAIVVKLSRAPIGTAHFLCFILREFANSSVMRFILDPVSSKALAQIGCALLFKILICAVTNRS